MIDPTNITDFKRNRAQLEEFVLFATLLPTKPSHRMAQLLETMLANARLVYGTELTPFDIVRIWIDQGVLGQVLRRYNVGQYTRLERCWRELVWIKKEARTTTGEGEFIRRTIEFDLRSLEFLERVHGIGPKTARFIILHNVAGSNVIPIDTHWIKELRARGYPIRTVEKDGVVTVPVNNQTHAVYEGYALQEVKKSGLTAAEYDLEVWTKWNRATTKRAA